MEFNVEEQATMSEDDALEYRASRSPLSDSKVIRDLWLEGRLHDVVFQTSSGEEVAAHKVILAGASKVLLNLVERSDGDVIVVEVSGKTFVSLLTLIYNNSVKIEAKDKDDFESALAAFQIEAEFIEAEEFKNPNKYGKMTEEEMMDKFVKSSGEELTCMVDGCMKPFKGKASMKVHLRDCHIECGVVYTCPKCNFDCRSQDIFRKHMGTKHPEIKLSWKELLPKPRWPKKTLEKPKNKRTKIKKED